MAICIGVDIGGTKGAVLSFETESWQVLERIEFPAAPVEEYVLQLRQAVETLRGERPLRAIGIACGGPLDLRHGRVLQPPHLPDWHQTPIVELLGDWGDCPAILQNDANAGALAERYWGAGQGIDDVVFITFGTGFGAGIIANGRLVSGWSGQAGEIGHVRLRDTGPTAYGKAGSVEAYCSGGGIAERYQQEMRQIVESATAQEPEALQQLAMIGEDVGRALAIVVDLLNPRRIVLGGIYARHASLLAEPVRRGLAAEALPLNCRDVELVPAQLGLAIGDYATMAIVRDYLEGGS